MIVKNVSTRTLGWFLGSNAAREAFDRVRPLDPVWTVAGDANWYKGRGVYVRSSLLLEMPKGPPFLDGVFNGTGKSLDEAVIAAGEAFEKAVTPGARVIVANPGAEPRAFRRDDGLRFTPA